MTFSSPESNEATRGYASFRGTTSGAKIIGPSASESLPPMSLCAAVERHSLRYEPQGDIRGLLLPRVGTPGRGRPLIWRQEVRPYPAAAWPQVRSRAVWRVGW